MATWTNRELKDLKSDPNDYPYDDLRTPVSAIRLSGSQPPTSELYRGSSVLAFPSNADKTIYFEFQMSHMWAMGTPLDFHIHYVIPTSGAGAGAENVKWDFTYSWASIGESFPTETTVNTTIDVQDVVADVHGYGDIANIQEGGTHSVSSILLCSLTRDVSVADDYSDDVYMVSLDIHYQKERDGSYFETDVLRGDYVNKKGEPKNPFKKGAW